MQSIGLTKLAAGLYGVLALSAVYYTMRVNNDAALADVSAKELSVMSAIVLLPVISAWIGLRLVRSGRASWLLAIGQALALFVFAATFVLVSRSTEPMAPLLFVLVSMWIAAGLAGLLAVIWITDRRLRR